MGLILSSVNNWIWEEKSKWVFEKWGGFDIYYRSITISGAKLLLNTPKLFYEYLEETYPKYSELLDTLAVSFSSEAVNFGDYSDTFTNHIINADMLESITSDIASKADKNHTHNYAASKHTHTISDITNYETPAPYDDTEVRELIRGKADTNHTHNYAAS